MEELHNLLEKTMDALEAARADARSAEASARAERQVRFILPRPLGAA
jgi:hypothetical protein